jgi:simple sugar transport system ATP-binding protein
MPEPIIQLRNVSKTFGAVYALQDVSLAIYDKEIVALLGDNGAGKSTLIKIISGVHSPDSGEVHVRGKKAERWNVARARMNGIETVYQDKALAEQQTVTRNIFMGREVTGLLGFLDGNKQREEARALMHRIGFTSKAISPDSIIASLSGGERQGVAIARALYFKADVIVLDEPTAALSLGQAKEVLSFVRRAKEEGSSVVFITHNIYHAHEVADRLVILDRGQHVGEFPKGQVSATELVQYMQSVARGTKPAPSGAATRA